MSHCKVNLSRLAPAALLLLLGSACSGTNLGQIDESVDSREEMPGPGIFADDEGESSLKWSNDSSEPSATAATATATDTSVTQEQAEFEQFKAWNDLRSNGSESAEYQEFQQWLEYQKFKSNQ